MSKILKLTAKQQAEYQAMTDKLAALDAEKQNKIAAAKFPVEGLVLSEDGRITLGGIPFEQSCTSDQIKVSLAIGAMLNPNLRAAAAAWAAEGATARDEEILWQRVRFAQLVDEAFGK